MKERQLSRIVSIVAALSVALIASSGAHPSTANASPTEEAPSTSTQIVTFEHSVSLDDAIKTASDLGEIPEAFRFDNGNLVGEFSPDGPVPASEFVSTIQKTYGVSPAFVGFSIRRPIAELASMTDDRLKPTVPVSSPELVALRATPPSNMGAPRSLESPAEATVEAEADWRPDGAYLYTTNYGTFTQRAYFSHYYEWQSPSSLELLPAEHGLEFEVNLYNDDDWMVGSRPVCYIGPYAAYDHRARFWAINQNFTWYSYTASSFAGTDWYFDYNDFSDECGRNSIALGMRYPQVLEGTDFSIQFGIWAPRGMKTSSLTGAVIQVVTDSFCRSDIGSTLALTDCMGVDSLSNWPTDIATSRMVLNADGAHRSPGICWTSYGKGEVPAVVSTNC